MAAVAPAVSPAAGKFRQHMVGFSGSPTDEIEIAAPPRFAIGERVASRCVIRNDGTYGGKDIGALLVQRGEVGFVRSIGTFLQQHYIYAVEFTATGHQVGMRARELCTLDHLPPEVLAALGGRAGDLAALR